MEIRMYLQRLKTRILSSFRRNCPYPHKKKEANPEGSASFIALIEIQIKEHPLLSKPR